MSNTPEHTANHPAWLCEDCGWPWPLPGDPPAGSECDNCGGEIIPDAGG